MPLLARVEAEMRDGRALDLGLCHVALMRERRGVQRFLVMRETGEALRGFLPTGAALVDPKPPSLRSDWSGERVDLRLTAIEPEMAMVPLLGHVR